MSGTFPVVVTTAGLTPLSPIDAQTQLLAIVAAEVPGYTANLPGSLIEDISSTDVAAIVQCNSAAVDAVNNITPYGCNNFVLNQLGAIYGVNPGTGANTSVYVVFTGTPGYTIAPGFTVSDGTNQYQVTDGTIIPSGGVTGNIFVLANNSGAFAVPANTVTQIVTSVPSPISLSVTNPNPGTPSPAPQTPENYRALVLQAGTSVAQGMPSTLRTALNNIPGVETNLISIQQASTGYRIIVGGSGDPYLIGNAIFESLFDFYNLVGSAISSGRNVTVGVINYPDTYSITFVNPVAQAVTMIVTWNTISGAVIAPSAISSLAAAPIAAYINGIYVGQPINLFELQATFQEAVASVIPTPLLTRMIFEVYINSILTPPLTGTGEIVGDPEGFFTMSAANVAILQG